MLLKFDVGGIDVFYSKELDGGGTGFGMLNPSIIKIYRIL
jgi:hypothetical protein